MERGSMRVMVAFLIVVTVWIYASMAEAPFVYEDRGWIDQVGPAQTFDLIRWPGRVVTQATYRWQAVEGHSQPRPLHLMNVVLHLLCGAFVYGVSRRLHLSRTASWYAAAVFLWHPLNVAAVAYVSARSDLLMTLFSLIAVWLAVRRTWWAPPIVVAACLLAGGSKELGAVAFALVLWTWYPRWLVTAGLAAAVAAVVLEWDSYGIRSLPAVGTWIELATGNVMSLWRVLWLMVVPIGGSMDPDPWFWPLSARLVGLMTLVSVGWWMWTLNRPRVRWALGWIAIVLVPRILLPTYEPIHDQHAYTAMVGFSVVTGRWLGGDQT